MFQPKSQCPVQPKSQSHSHWTLLFILVLITLLIWEWMKPLTLLSDTHSVHLFLLFFISVLVLNFLKTPWSVQLVLNSLLMLYLLHELYFEISFLSREWLAYWLDDWRVTFRLILERRWADISFLSRTFAFFFLIWYAAVCLFREAVLKRRMLWFVLLTITYLAVLDTFTVFDASGAIVRTFVLGFSLLIFLQMSRNRNSAGSQEAAHKQRSPFIWMVSGTGVMLLCTFIAVIAPKAGPAWPDPVPFMAEYSFGDNQASNSGSIRRSGYGSSDSVLGGPFVQDDTIVFRAETESGHYWRGESKDFYTGQGWKSTGEVERLFSAEQIGDVWEEYVPLYAQSSENDGVQVTVSIEEDAWSQIFYPGDIRSLKVTPSTEHLSLSAPSGKLTLKDDEGQHRPLKAYQLVGRQPVFSVEDLLDADMSQVPEDLRATYTQLPETLPERVKTLARDETQGLETVYEQVKHLESFFRMNDFEYNIDDVPVPDEGQDYVDQFLFETKRGYCDHFSTAMVVMLRTLDIPARWVKGFTAGELQYEGEGRYTSIVRRLNAHSWVEVYFPDVGWVPFEPTRTFANPFTFEQDEALESMAGVDEEEESAEQDEEEDEANSEISGSLNDETDAGHLWSDRVRAMVWFALAALFSVILLIAVYFFSKTGFRVRKKERFETLREYVQSLASSDQYGELKTLIRQFESMRYGPNAGQYSTRRKARQMWDAIMKKLRS